MLAGACLQRSVNEIMIKMIATLWKRLKRAVGGDDDVVGAVGRCFLCFFGMPLLSRFLLGAALLSCPLLATHFTHREAPASLPPTTRAILEAARLCFRCIS